MFILNVEEEKEVLKELKECLMTTQVKNNVTEN